jgi:hypothetical protein
MTREELEERITDLEEENQELQDRLDSIMDIARPEEDEDEDECGVEADADGYHEGD